MLNPLMKQRKTKAQMFSNKKNKWRKQVRTHLNRCDGFATEVLKGRAVGYSVLIEAAHRLVALGNRGEALVEELNSIRPSPPKRQVTQGHIAAACHAIESMATVLEYLVDEQCLPKLTFPVWKSNLQAPMHADTSSLESTDFILDRIRERVIEEGEDEG